MGRDGALNTEFFMALCSSGVGWGGVEWSGLLALAPVRLIDKVPASRCARGGVFSFKALILTGGWRGLLAIISETEMLTRGGSFHCPLFLPDFFPSLSLLSSPIHAHATDHFSFKGAREEEAKFHVEDPFPADGRDGRSWEMGSGKACCLACLLAVLIACLLAYQPGLLESGWEVGGTCVARPPSGSK